MFIGLELFEEFFNFYITILKNHYIFAFRLKIGKFDFIKRIEKIRLFRGTYLKYGEIDKNNMLYEKNFNYLFINRR